MDFSKPDGGKIKNDFRKQNHLLQEVIDFLPDPLFAIDTEGKIILWNNALEELTGKTARDTLGKGNFHHSYCLFGKYKPCIVDVIIDPSLLNEADLVIGGSVINKVDERYLYGEINCVSGPENETWFRIKASPLYSADGNLLGAAAVLQNITEEKLQESKIKQLNCNDSLTGFYNRTFLESELKAIDNDNNLPLSIIRAEINGLKLINETFGCHEGDNLIIRGASVIKNCCNVDDAAICRWNGSGFAILLPKTDRTASLAICRRISDLCEQYNESPVFLSIYCGAATKISPSDDIQKILEEAELMMSRNQSLVSKDLRGNLISSLQKLLEEKTEETIEHASRINTYATKIGTVIGLSTIELHELALLAALHDVGKIAIPDTIILKSESLTPDEWEIMRKHTEIGYNMTRSIPELAHVASKILHHHEWWNGEGYPDGLAGEDIPLLARIIAVVDAFDVMTSGRSYKKSLSREKALEELRNYSGTHFEPRLVDIFIQIQEEENPCITGNNKNNPET